MANTSKDNQVAGYVTPYMAELVKADAKVNDKTASRIINEALKCYYDKITPEQQRALINRSKNIY